MARNGLLTFLALYFTCAAHVPAHAISPLQGLGAQRVNRWRLDQQEQQLQQRNQVASTHNLAVQDGATEAARLRRRAEFEPQWFEQPLDHFDKSNTHTWKQRFWVNTRHYQARQGAPVFVLDGGETSGEDRIPFLDTGIIDIITSATNGIGVVLEHRYYGESVPVENFTTDSLRWLTNEQASADSANFMANVKFDGINEDVTAPNTPWIYYGGSYAGARAAHMKVLYPDLVYGAIASSGVTHAEIENWQYMEIIRKAADPKCSKHLVNSIKIIDSILLGKSARLKRLLKKLFGLADLEHDDDFASALTFPLGSWQSKNWDPAVGSTEFDQFCSALSAPFGNISAKEADSLPFGDPAREVEVDTGFTLDFSIINYAKYIKENVVTLCRSDDVEDCFGTYNDTNYQQTTLDQTWRLWQFQVCTQWGYFTTSPPDPHQPRIISKLNTLPYLSKICKQAFLPGKFIQVPPLPNVTAVNALGDFDIAADRLAIIDGEVDPWRPETPHSDNAKPRPDTVLRPFKLIPGAVHHWDENGVAELLDEPAVIRNIHADEVAFVEQWLEDWKPPSAN